MKQVKNIFIVLNFFLLLFGAYKAIENKEFISTLIILSVLFIFSFLMLKSKPVKNFHIGGDKLSVSVNEDDDDPKK